ncbi:MAG: DegT/DnrJ/EryC1/StrS family aminotransferase [Candidatus Omnitrophica bacterium]|nr:DegT/DnrJ/EryC1/StrS family aminotransferase [Candidatus Omnitrophota bacterium]
MIHHSKPSIGKEEKNACLAVLDSLYLAQGQKVHRFEELLAEKTGRRYGVAVSSGTTALQLALLAQGVSIGDEVIIPSYTCVALLHALDFVRAKPVLVDSDPEDLNMSVDQIRTKITRKTKAIIVPHLFGRAADMKKIVNLGVPVIEDGTQAIGATVNKKNVGSWGVMSVFSFYATKMLTTGEGGVILTDSSKKASFLNDVRDYDKKDSYRFRTNSKMTDLEAAMGIEQLKKLTQFVRARRKIAEFYNGELKKLELELPVDTPERPHIYFRYVLRASAAKTQGLIRALNRGGIEAKQPVYKPLHRYLKLSDRDFPVASEAVKTTCSLPIFPALRLTDMHRSALAVCRFVQ